MKIESNYQELLPVTARAMALAVDYAHGHVISVHRHSHAQLIHAIKGVMTIETDSGRWVVPPTRGVWLRPRPECATPCRQRRQRRCGGGRRFSGWLL